MLIHAEGGHHGLPPSWDEVQTAVAERLQNVPGARQSCISCGQPLTNADLRGYPHDQGYPVLIRGPDGQETVEVLWLYLECPCGYGNALWKLRLGDLPTERIQ